MSLKYFINKKKPRIFTICRTSLSSPRKAEIVISVKHDKLPENKYTQKSNKNKWTGLISEYFLSLQNKEKSKMRYIIQSSSFTVII